MSAIPVLVPTFLMLMFMLLYVSSQRQLRRAWRRESEYQIIINDLMRKSGSVTEPVSEHSSERAGAHAPVSNSQVRNDSNRPRGDRE